MCQVSCFFFLGGGGDKKRDSEKQWKKCSGIQDFRRSGIAGTKHPFQTPVVDDYEASCICSWTYSDSVSVE